MSIWHNSIAVLANSQKRWLHDDAKKVLEAIAKEWKRRSRRLPFNPEEYFRWPSTDAPLGLGGMAEVGWLQSGMFTFLGYRVGRREGKPADLRRLILSQAFTSDLPPAFPPYYMTEWGMPNSSGRLQKMAETIAAFTRNAKRRNDERLAEAIADWEQDLEYLYSKYYVGKFHFGFPSTELM